MVRSIPCIVGTDAPAAGDVCNKIGTYLKALAARDNDVPFYVALPSSTIDWSLGTGSGDIPIEQRDRDEVTHSGPPAEAARSWRRRGLLPSGGRPVANYAFDATPACGWATALITEARCLRRLARGAAGVVSGDETPRRRSLRQTLRSRRGAIKQNARESNPARF